MEQSVLSVSLPEELLEGIDKIAKKENRTRSEILGYAAGMYIKRKQDWERIYAYGESLAAEYGITEEVIAEEIRLYREEQNAKNK
jgi:metal-responsive CopG/Arc/MetJ family transcriptional regulator